MSRETHAWRHVAGYRGPVLDTAGAWDAVQTTATFWLETLQGQTAPTQLQYTQTVLLNFAGISWPHVTVGTLHKA